MHRIAGLAVAVVLLGAAPAFGFDYARYEAIDLDALMMQPRPAKGIDLYPARPFKLAVTLVSYAEGCQTVLLKKAMLMAGIAKDQVDAVKVMGCIKVRSAKGADLRLFIQDVVSGFLPREIPLGSPVTLFAIHVFTAPEGPGLMVNDFATEAGNDSAKSGRAPGQQANGAPCGCGSADFHPGIDVTNDAAGAPVQVVDDGIVVKVEQDEQASVDAPGIGRCGRYVVVRHDYPDGRAVFTRYAQLGRIIDADGRSIAPGARVKKSSKIGEVGSSKILHFEVRPVDPKTMETGAGWTARYGSDPAMAWSRYQPVDPRGFDPDTFGRTGGGVK
jgi:hypothetical protein